MEVSFRRSAIAQIDNGNSRVVTVAGSHGGAGGVEQMSADGDVDRKNIQIVGAAQAALIAQPVAVVE